MVRQRVFFTAVALTLGFYGGWTDSFAAETSIGVVKLVNVGAYGTPSGESQREIFVRSAVFSNELVETVARGAAHLRFVDDTEIRIGSSGRLVLDRFVYSQGSNSDRLVASLSRGALRFISGKMAKPGVQIVTPAVLIGIRGTDFTVTVDDAGNTAVAVAEGIVELTPLGGGGAQLLTVGQVASIGVGAAAIDIRAGSSVSEDPGLRSDGGVGGDAGGNNEDASGSAESCFATGTRVLMADGTRKAIEEIRAGDTVAGYDFGTDSRVAAKVLAVHSDSASSHLLVNGIGVTRRHPFAVGKDRWKVAGTLMRGDQLYGDAKIRVQVVESVVRETEVYNLTVASTANYYVADGSRLYLVHNKN